MNQLTSYTAFFSLLRAGLFGKVPEDFCEPLSAERWGEIYIIAQKQTVAGIVYDGMVRLPGELLPPKSLLIKWTIMVGKIEYRNNQAYKVSEELNALFAANRIFPYLLKGQGIGRCYEQPLHRVCGDIDWLFLSNDDMNHANRLIQSRGIKVEYQSVHSSLYWWDGIPVEHHNKLLDIHNPFLAGYLRTIWNEESIHSIRRIVKEGILLQPSPLLVHVILNAHILKHMLACGIGLRQLCDMARAYYTYHDVTNADQLKSIYKKVGLLKWTNLLHAVLVEYMGLPKQYLPFYSTSPQADVDWLMNEIMSGGNFGFYDTRFGRNPEKRWYQKAITFRVMIRKTYFFMKYAPGESFWFPMMLLGWRLRKYMLLWL